MTITERVKDVIQTYAESEKKGSFQKQRFTEGIHRGFQGHSISDRQINPYLGNTKNDKSQVVTFYN